MDTDSEAGGVQVADGVVVGLTVAVEVGVTEPDAVDVLESLAVVDTVEVTEAEGEAVIVTDVLALDVVLTEAVVVGVSEAVGVVVLVRVTEPEAETDSEAVREAQSPCL